MKKYFLLLGLIFISLQSIAQSWSKLGVLSTNSPEDFGSTCIALDPSGNVYTSGYFKNTGGYYYVTKWNGSSWNELGSLNANGLIQNIETDASGNVYAMGDFTNASGKYYVAKWDGSSWAELGTGANALNATSSVEDIAFDQSGNAYAGGDGVEDAANKGCVKKWNGTSWVEVGSGLSATVHEIAVDHSGNVYAFADNGSGFSQRIVKWNGTSWDSNLGSRAYDNNSTYHIALDAAGNLYSSGYYDNATNTYYVAKWNGSAWSVLGTGANALGVRNTIRTITTDSFGNVYVAGQFEDGYSAVYVAKWNGTKWVELGGLDHNIPDYLNSYHYNQIDCIVSDAAGNVFAGGSFIDNNNKHYIAKWTSGLTVTANQEPSDHASLSAYPNPAQHLVQLTIKENGTVKIINTRGEVLKTFDALESTVEFDMSTFPSGIYTLLFTGQEKSYATMKLVKE